MIKKNFVSLIIIGICILIRDFHVKQSLSNSTGAPPGYTNSPSDGANCSACHPHIDSVIGNVNWISTDIPPQGYYHSGLYNITVTIPEPGLKGFEISVQDAFGNQSGSMTTGINTQIVGSGKYITHSTPGNSNPQTWSFQWFPGYGNLTLYGAFTVDANSTYIQTLTLTEEPCINCHPGIPDPDFNSTSFYSFLIGNAVRIFMNTSANKNMQLSMYSANGDLIKTYKNVFPASGPNYFDIETGTLNDGIYFIVLSSDAFTKTLKILISK